MKAAERHAEAGHSGSRARATILDMLKARGAGKIICASKPARAIADFGQRAAWQPLLEPPRAAARRLVAGAAL
jgi:hypothetical protein